MKNQIVGATIAATLGFSLAGPAWSQRAPVPVTVAAVRTMPVRHTIQLPGTVVAARSARLSSAIGGLVETVEVDFGDRVQSDQTLVQLDRKLVRLQLEQAQAAVQEAIIDAREKQRLLRVGRSLTRRGVVTKDQLDTRRAAMQSAQVVVKKLRAAEGEMREMLNRHEIVAPFSGVVAKKYVESGEWVSPGMPVVQLVADEDMSVDVSLPQKYYARLNDETEIAMTFDALPGKSIAGDGIAMSPVSDSTTRTFVLRIALPTDAKAQRSAMGGAAIAPGMSANVKLTLRGESNSIVVPRDAIVRQADGRTSVWAVTLTPGNPGAANIAKVTEKTIRIGRSFDSDVIVLNGLAEGAQVVVSGNESLRPGQKVRIDRAQ